VSIDIDLPSLLERVYYRHPSFLIDTVAEHESGSRLIAIKNEQFLADTEELRQAMIHYRSLFEELLEVEPAAA